MSRRLLGPSVAWALCLRSFFFFFCVWFIYRMGLGFVPGSQRHGRRVPSIAICCEDARRSVFSFLATLGIYTEPVWHCLDEALAKHNVLSFLANFVIIESYLIADGNTGQIDVSRPCAAPHGYIRQSWSVYSVRTSDTRYKHKHCLHMKSAPHLPVRLGQPHTNPTLTRVSELLLGGKGWTGTKHAGTLQLTALLLLLIQPAWAPRPTREITLHRRGHRRRKRTGNHPGYLLPPSQLKQA